MKRLILAAGLMGLVVSGAMAQGSGAAGDIGGAAVRPGTPTTVPAGQSAATTPAPKKMARTSGKAAKKKM